MTTSRFLGIALTVAACGSGAQTPRPGPAEPTFVPLAIAPAAAVEARPQSGSRPNELLVAGPESRENIDYVAKRHRSPILDGEPRAARLSPGTYACRIDAMYKFRPCEITKDARGFTNIAMPGALVELQGVLYDDGPAIVIDGTSGDRRPFGCVSCDDLCTTTASSCVHCTELMRKGARECLEQPLTTRLTRVGAIWRGQLSIFTYSGHYEGVGSMRLVTSFDKDKQSFLVEIAPASSLPRN